MILVKYILFLALLLPFNMATNSFKENTLESFYNKAAISNGVDYRVLKAICEVETNHNTKLKKIWDGGSYSYGICQVKLGTARAMGFKGSDKELSNPEINIEFAARYLAYQLKRYKGNYKKAIVSYNRGSYTNEETKSYQGKVALAFLTNQVKGR